MFLLICKRPSRASKSERNLSSDKPVEQHEPVALDWLIANKIDLWVWCEDCSHHARLSSELALQKFGNLSVPQIRQRLHCSKCRSRVIFVRPDWPRQGVVARHEPL